VDTLFTALRVIVSLAVVVGLLWFVQRKSVRWTRKKTPEKISVLGKQSLGSKAHVLIVEADGTRFILGVTERGVSVLKSRDAVSFADELAEAGHEGDESDERDERDGNGGDGTEIDGSVGPKPLRLAPVIATPAKPAKREHFGSSSQEPVTAASFMGSITSAETWKKAAQTLRTPK
jgi:flagellar protein FliO/FliZ